jgi:hypothetical protein
MVKKKPVSIDAKQLLEITSKFGGGDITFDTDEFGGIVLLITVSDENYRMLEFKFLVYRCELTEAQ